jgi:PrtD family type I secretion system ABC transporter
MRAAPPSAQVMRQGALHRALAGSRSAFVIVGVFSFAINVLMLASPLYMLQVYDRVLTTGRVETLLLLTVMACTALLILGALDALRAAVLVRIGTWLNERLGPVLLATSVEARLQGDASGSQPLRELGQLQSFVGGQPITVFFDSPWVPAFVVLIWLLHPLLGLVALGAAALLLVLSLVNEAITRAPIRQANQAQISAMQRADSTIHNAEVVQAMGMLPALLERWRSDNDVALGAARLAAERGGAIVGFTKFARFFVQIAILGLGALLVLRGELTPGGMIAASILLGRALAPVEQAMGAWRNFTAARIAYSRLKLKLANAEAPTVPTRLPDPTGRLQVEHLSYVPSGVTRPVLRGMSFELEPGDALAVIGPSAAGKSSLCRLLVGIAAPTSGKVRLDGAEIGHWDPVALGRFIGYLPQDVELFSGTVRENIARMGNGSDAAVVEAARLAHAHEMILRLPQGYGTQIGEGGARLSGGQRQRIGLARAVYGVPTFIVLDEPNANLDQAGEAALAAALVELKERGSTLIIIGHRPSTLAQADKILFLRDGRIDAFGPRDAVLQQMRQAAETATPTSTPQIQPAPKPVRIGASH